MSSATHDRLDELRASVQEDPALLPEEKETAIHFAKADKSYQIMTYEAGVGRRLLAHPEAERVEVTLLDGDARPRVPLEEWDGRPIVGVAAKLPVGALLVPSEGRKSDQHAKIVSGRVLDLAQESGGNA